MVHLTGREFRLFGDGREMAGNRLPTVHEGRAARRQGSLALAYAILLATDPDAVAGELAPTFPEPMIESQTSLPSNEAMTGAQFLTQNDVELVG